MTGIHLKMNMREKIAISILSGSIGFHAILGHRLKESFAGARLNVGRGYAETDRAIEDSYKTECGYYVPTAVEIRSVFELLPQTGAEANFEASALPQKLKEALPLSFSLLLG